MNLKIKDVTEYIASDMRLISLAVKGTCCKEKKESKQKERGQVEDEISDKDLSNITIS